jgi:hypothetical protein
MSDTTLPALLFGHAPFELRLVPEPTGRTLDPTAVVTSPRHGVDVRGPAFTRDIPHARTGAPTAYRSVLNWENVQLRFTPARSNDTTQLVESSL